MRALHLPCLGLMWDAVRIGHQGDPQLFPCYDRPMIEALKDELDRLTQRREYLKIALATKKREVVRLQKKRSQTLEISCAASAPASPPPERKLRSRRRIVIGSLMENEHSRPTCSASSTAPSIGTKTVLSSTSLPNPPPELMEPPPSASATLRRWRPARLPDGFWESSSWGRIPKAPATGVRWPFHHVPGQKRYIQGLDRC